MTPVPDSNATDDHRKPAPPAARARLRVLGVLCFIPALLAVTALVVLRVHGYWSERTAAPAAPAATAPPTASAPAARHPPHGELEENGRDPKLPTQNDRPSSEDETALLPVTRDMPIWGSENALVTVVLFGDLDCPFTRFSLRTLARIKDEMPRDVRLVFRHRPTTPGGRAVAAFAARLYERHGSPAFWRFAFRASRAPGAVTLDFVRNAAPALALTPGELKSLWQAQDESPLEADWHWAVRFAVRRTPTLFVNGQRLDELSGKAALTELIRQERRAQLSLLAEGVGRRALYRERVKNMLVGLGSEAPERQCVPLGAAPLRGALAAAPVTIVEFSDFGCPHCAALDSTLGRLLRAFPVQLRLAWKSFPIDAHPDARAAANLVEHALASGGSESFWKLHDGLYQMSAPLGAASFKPLLERLGLDADAHLEAAKSGSYDARINDDLRLGQEIGVEGVPTRFVNGRKLEGAQDFRVLEELVKSELKAVAHFTRAGFGPQRLSEALCTSE